MLRHVVMFSGGIGSWAAAKRVAEAHGTDGVVLLFTDTLIEDPDVYRFLTEAAANVGAPLVRIADGRTPWEVFGNVRLVGNAQRAPCSRVLKQEPARRWVRENCDAATTLYVGISWDEAHRLAGAKRGWVPYHLEAPLCDRPYLDKRDLMAWARAEGLEPPAMYAQGFPHANCGGGCVRAGHAQWRLLLRTHPERFARWEAEEEALRTLLGDVAILKDTRQAVRKDGKAIPLPLRELRRRVECSDQLPLFDDDWGGCGCFVDE